MLTMEEAKKIGISACIDKIGYEFCKAHPDNGVSAYGASTREGYVYCFVGVSDQPEPTYDENHEWLLTHDNTWPFYASCDVNLEDGSVEFLECKLP